MKKIEANNVQKVDNTIYFLENIGSYRRARYSEYNNCALNLFLKNRIERKKTELIVDIFGWREWKNNE